jgi:hypothetical protein
MISLTIRDNCHSCLQSSRKTSAGSSSEWIRSAQFAQDLRRLDDDPAMNELRACADSLGLDRIERHIFLCADQREPKCCAKEVIGGRAVEEFACAKNSLDQDR